MVLIKDVLLEWIIDVFAPFVNLILPYTSLVAILLSIYLPYRARKKTIIFGVVKERLELVYFPLVDKLGQVQNSCVLDLLDFINYFEKKLTSVKYKTLLGSDKITSKFKIMKKSLYEDNEKTAFKEFSRFSVIVRSQFDKLLYLSGYSIKQSKRIFYSALSWYLTFLILSVLTNLFDKLTYLMGKYYFSVLYVTLFIIWLLCSVCLIFETFSFLYSHKHKIEEIKYLISSKINKRKKSKK